ncbi:MAG: hypothetical protein AAFR59_02520 [Bacteroidota bacterium]
MFVSCATAQAYKLDLDAQSWEEVPSGNTNTLFELVITSISLNQFDRLNIIFQKEGENDVRLSSRNLNFISMEELKVAKIDITTANNPIDAINQWRTPYKVRITYGNVSKLVTIGIADEPDDRDTTETIRSNDFDCEKLLQSKSMVNHSIRFGEAVYGGDKEPLICLLNFYGRRGQNPPNTYNDFVDAFKDNPYIRSILTDIGPNTTFNWSAQPPVDMTNVSISRSTSISQDLGQDARDPAANAQSLLLDGLNTLFPPSEVLPALAKFTADRFKEEINIAFLSRLKNRIEASRELRALFPNSRQLLVHSDIFNYNIFIADLKEAFDDDLENMDRNIADYLRDNRVEISKLTKSAAALATAIDFALLSYDSWKAEEAGLHPAEIVRIWGNYDFSDLVPRNVQSAIRTLALISKNLEVSQYNGNKLRFGWATQAELLQLSRDKTAIRAFLGFIYEVDEATMKDIKFDVRTSATDSTIKVVSLWDLFQNNSPKADRLVEFVFDLLHQIQQVQTIAGNIKTQQGSENYRRSYGLYADAIGDILSVFLKKGNNFWEPTEDQEKVLQKIAVFIYLNRELNELVLAARNREFEDVLLQGVNILSKIYEFADSTTYAPALRELVQVGTFMTSVAQADSSAEILEIIQKAAQPVKSYAVKRSNRFSASINAFVGGAGGMEIYSANAVKSGSTGNIQQGFIAFSAPIGIALSLGPKRDKLNYRESIGKNILAGSSHTLFFSLIDIGALTAVSLTSDTLLEDLPDLSWENVFAPGAHYFWGIPTTPLALGVGAQFGPSLRNLNGTNNSVRTSGFRVQAALTVDIPFYTVSAYPGKYENVGQRRANKASEKAAKKAARQAEKN